MKAGVGVSGAGEQQVSAEQGYDAAGNIVKIVQDDGGYTYYNYDGLNQLTQEIQKDSGDTQL